MHRLWKVQRSIKCCPFSYNFPTPNGPRQVSDESMSVPTLALKSLRTTICSVLAVLLMMKRVFVEFILSFWRGRQRWVYALGVVRQSVVLRQMVRIAQNRC